MSGMALDTEELRRIASFQDFADHAVGRKSWTFAKYGGLTPEWREDLAAGFSECFRVLRPEGVLIFKWNEVQIPVSEILGLTPHRPLVGHRSGKRSDTHWMTFLKPAVTEEETA